MKAVSGTQMRSLDRRTISEAGISGAQLMERAGLLAGAGILRWLAETGLDRSGPEIVVLAGKGNNGGDAFVVARLLSDSGYDVSLHCAAPGSELAGDALTMFRRLPSPVRDHISFELTGKDVAGPDRIVVDGLLGTGFHGTLREPYKTWCRLVNGSGLPVVALDIPSGLDADSGEADPDSITADITFTMAAPKTGMFSPEGIRRTARIRVLDIGIPSGFVDDLPDTVECTDSSAVKKLLIREPFDVHKYTRGHLFVAGGCTLYPGAPLLASEAALRTGAGLVSCFLPGPAEIYGRVPKALILRKLVSPTGFFSAAGASELLSTADRAGAFVVGPGMGCAVECTGFLEKMLGVKAPLLLDADALNLLVLHPGLIGKLKEREFPTVVTPHPGEMKRLASVLALDTGASSRPEIAVSAAKQMNAYVIYKGPRTVVAAPDGRAAVNLSGCPALATAGTGDILSGMAGAFLLNREAEVFDSLRAAVFLHGHCAELAAPLGSRGFIADDFLPRIGEAVRRLRPSA